MLTSTRILSVHSTIAANIPKQLIWMITYNQQGYFNKIFYDCCFYPYNFVDALVGDSFLGSSRIHPKEMSQVGGTLSWLI